MEPVDSESILLGTFYRAWVDLHRIPRDQAHRKRAEQQAQVLVDAHHALQRFYGVTIQ